MPDLSSVDGSCDNCAKPTEPPRAGSQARLVPDPSYRDTKPSNPKDAIGTAKVSTWFVPSRVLLEVGVALLEGARKYGPFNWRTAGVRASVYVSAAERHLSAWKEGQDLDPDSGLSHVTKAIAGLTVLRDSMLQGNWVDDRPTPTTDKETWVADLNAKVKEILARYP